MTEQPSERAAIEEALSPDLSDVEAEAALVSVGIYTWGPDGERFEKMFRAAMECRAAIRAHMEQRNDEHKEIQEKGAICRRIGAYKLDNPYLKIENMPGTTGEPFEDWQAKHDAWELGWVVQDMMI